MKLLPVLCVVVALALSAVGAAQLSLNSGAPKTIISGDELYWQSNEAFSNLPEAIISDVLGVPADDTFGIVEVPLPKDNLDVAKTLTSIVSKFSSGLSIVSDLMSGVKLIASFFKTTYTTETNEHYWEELCETAQAMVNEAIDDTIIKQTNDAVDRLSENLQLYINTNSTEGDFSALELSLLMDNQLNSILSLYAGINHVERISMHYLDMATTRLALWQATSLRYIDEYTIEGELPSGGSVCDIVQKWDLAFTTETKEITSKLTPALKNWNDNYRNLLNMSCTVSYEHPTFHEWRRQADCKIFDGYHGNEAEHWHNRCHEKTDPKCPGLEFICFNYCKYDRLYPYISNNSNQYSTLHGLLNSMTANFLVVQKSQLDEYKDQCGL